MRWGRPRPASKPLSTMRGGNGIKNHDSQNVNVGLDNAPPAGVMRRMRPSVLPATITLPDWSTATPYGFAKEACVPMPSTHVALPFPASVDTVTFAVWHCADDTDPGGDAITWNDGNAPAAHGTYIDRPLFGQYACAGHSTGNVRPTLGQ